MSEADKKKLTGSAEACKKAIDFFGQAGLPTQAAYSKITLVKFHIRSDNGSEAVSVAEQAYEYFKAKGDPWNEAACLAELCNAKLFKLVRDVEIAHEKDESVVNPPENELSDAIKQLESALKTMTELGDEDGVKACKEYYELQISRLTLFHQSISPPDVTVYTIGNVFAETKTVENEWNFSGEN